MKVMVIITKTILMIIITIITIMTIMIMIVEKDSHRFICDCQ